MLYPDAPCAIRSDIVAEQERAWAHIATPGSWFTGAERVAIADETRRAFECRLCAARKEAISPNAVAGAHDRGELGRALSDEVVEVVHRVTTDPARLTKSWLDDLLARGLEIEAYVEAVGVAIHTISMDTFARGLGLAPRDLPAPRAGEASGYRPAGAKPGPAWVPMIAPEDAIGREADIYDGMMGAYVQQALTAVPNEQRSWFGLVGAQYLNQAQMRDFEREPRAISHAQIEFLAGRISALNQCLY